MIDAITLIHINQYNLEKQNLEKEWFLLEMIISDTSGLVNTTVLNKT